MKATFLVISRKTGESRWISAEQLQIVVFLCGLVSITTPISGGHELLLQPEELKQAASEVGL
jgi:hypothetical protein